MENPLLSGIARSKGFDFGQSSIPWKEIRKTFPLISAESARCSRKSLLLLVFSFLFSFALSLMIRKHFTMGFRFQLIEDFKLSRAQLCAGRTTDQLGRERRALCCRFDDGNVSRLCFNSSNSVQNVLEAYSDLPQPVRCSWPAFCLKANSSGSRLITVNQ